MFLAQASHESNKLAKIKENLRYSDPARIALIFRSGFDLDKDRVVDPEEIEFAKAYVKQPAKLANRAYANRMGNGSVASGDGWKYIGRGPIQRTGKSGYVRTKSRTGIDVLTYPELLLSPKEGSIAAVDYWDDNKLNVYADKGDFDGVCDIINIGRKT